MFNFFKLSKEELIVWKQGANAVIEFEREYLCLDDVDSHGFIHSGIGDNETFPCIFGHGAVFTHSLLLLGITQDTEC